MLQGALRDCLLRLRISAFFLSFLSFPSFSCSSSLSFVPRVGSFGQAGESTESGGLVSAFFSLASCLSNQPRVPKHAHAGACLHPDAGSIASCSHLVEVHWFSLFFPMLAERSHRRRQNMWCGRSLGGGEEEEKNRKRPETPGAR